MSESLADARAKAAQLLREIPGGSDLLQWFEGRVPSFHDAEILSLALDRKDASGCLKLHAFEMTSEVDANGYFVLTKHVVVSFQFRWISDLELVHFNHQNAIYGLRLSRTDDELFRLELEDSYGLSGFIEAHEIAIAIAPGKP